MLVKLSIDADSEYILYAFSEKSPKARCKVLAKLIILSARV